ncbi:MAG: serine/threonine-protein kinase [Pseudomonadota bacterium]
MSGLNVSLENDTDLETVNCDALAPGSKLLSGQYEIMRYLSSGGFGITYLAKDSLNRTVVIKECFPEAFCNRVNKTVRARTKNYLDDFRSIVTLFIREAHALSRLDHPSVVGVHQVFEDNETAYMALDLIDGNDLLEVIERKSQSMSAGEIQAMTLKLLDAIAHVHGQDLLHRDISPDNILVDREGHPVLIDFGAAREEASRTSRVLSSVLVVKDGYSPQEFYVAGSQQMPSSDLYALAATLTHLIAGKAPPNSQARLAALASSQPDLYEPLQGRFPAFDDAFLEAIDTAMNIAPMQRIQSAEEWILRIDPGKRAELARARAQNDQSIDRTVMDLVKTANAENGDGGRVAAVAPDDPSRETTGAQTQLLHPEAPVNETFVLQDDEATFDRASRAQSGALLTDASAVSVAAEHAPTPYVRVTEKAKEIASRPKPPPPPFWTPRRIIRYATIPVVFSAYFFYAYTVFQIEQVQAATLEPLLAFSDNFGSWGSPSRPDVTVRRGTGG